MLNKLKKVKVKHREILKKIKEIQKIDLIKSRKYLEKIIGKIFLNKYEGKMNDLKQRIDQFIKKVKDRKLFNINKK